VKKLSVALALVGLAVGTALVGSFGFRDVAQAVASAGWRGLAAVCVWQLVIFVPLGLAWDQLARIRGTARPLVFLWARMVRDTATNILPFSTIGGFVFGARALTVHGIGWPVATATTVVDITAEFLAEVGFVALGVIILLAHVPHAHAVSASVEIGLGFAILGIVLFVWAQRGAAPAFERIAARIAARRLGGARRGMAALNEELAELYRRPGRLLVCFLLHFVGWILSGMGDWVAYHAIGLPIDVDNAIAIEALLSGVSAAAFLVPVNAGVQEAGYAGFGALFGIPADLSLAVSLLRRARDITIGVPVLLLWQLFEARRLRAATG